MTEPSLSVESSPEGRTVALIGFMGAGKTTLGRILGLRMGRRFVDLDDLIVADAGLSIAEIFRQSGEERFRDLESAALARALAGEPVVLAPGGGAPMRPANRALLRERARTFFLDVPFDELRRRTAGDTGRPLRSRPSRELQALHESRLPVYRELGELIDAGDRSPDEVAALILEKLGRLPGGSPA